MPFQSSVNIYSAAGVPGAFAFDGPQRSSPYNLSSGGTPNVVGYAYTITEGGNPDATSGSPLAATAAVGGNADGTSRFAGILVNPQEYASYGTSSNPLAPTLTLPDDTIGNLAIMGEIWALVDNLPSVGDSVAYNPATGALSTLPPLTVFTGSIAAGGADTPDILTVSAVTSGRLQVGQLISGAGIPGGTYIDSLGTGLGYTGTYNLSTINELTIASTTMTAPNTPAPEFSGTATIATTTMTVASVVSGQVYVGMPVIGTGIEAGTVVTEFGTGVGGTGTYTINVSQTVTPAVAITDAADIVIPNAVVSHFDVTFPGLAVIKLTN